MQILFTVAYIFARRVVETGLGDDTVAINTELHVSCVLCVALYIYREHRKEGESDSLTIYRCCFNH